MSLLVPRSKGEIGIAGIIKIVLDAVVLVKVIIVESVDGRKWNKELEEPSCRVASMLELGPNAVVFRLSWNFLGRLWHRVISAASDKLASVHRHVGSHPDIPFIAQTASESLRALKSMYVGISAFIGSWFEV